jgi:hypothetical protein
MERLNRVDSELPIEYSSLLRSTFERLNGKDSVAMVQESELKKAIAEQDKSSAELKLVKQ